MTGVRFPSGALIRNKLFTATGPDPTVPAALSAGVKHLALRDV